MKRTEFDIIYHRRKVGERINEIRSRLGLTLQDFGASLDNPVNKGVVQKWETGINLPSDERAIEIAKLGDVSLNWLLYGLDYENYQNHKLPDAFRELEEFEIELREKQLSKLALYHIQENISENLKETLKNALKKDMEFVPEFLSNPFTRLQDVMNIVYDENPTRDEITAFNYYFNLLMIFMTAKKYNPDTYENVQEIMDSLSWLSGNHPTEVYKDNDIFRDFIDSNGFEAHINKVANNLHTQIDLLAQKLKDKYLDNTKPDN
ncbi:helix-turn-helix domain-containing protein [Lactococcus garvieae]|uniref:helix-turn-helix domain-containing protein n=1 Tax=Lactococcus garvieae TaxID=1363 RepID=UPI0032478F45